MQPAAGNFATPNWISMECTRLLTNKREAFEYATFDLEPEFKKDFAINDTVTYKFPQMYNPIDGPEFGGGAVNRRTGSATIDQWVQIPLEISTWDKMLKMERSKREISKNYLDPAMEQMLTEAERRYQDFMFFNTNNVVGALGANPTSWTPYANADNRIFKLAGLEGPQGNLLSADMTTTFIQNSLTQLVAADPLTKSWKKNIVGEGAGATWHRSNSMHLHTTGVWATVLTGVTVNGNGQSGTSINLNCTTGDTFKKGDIIDFASSSAVNPWIRKNLGYLAQFQIQADATGVASAVTLTIAPGIIGPGSPEQNVTALPANGDAVIMWRGTTMADATAKTGICGIRVNRNAFGVIPVEIPIPPQGGSIIISAHDQDPDSRMAVSILQFFDPVSHKWGMRYDSAYGFCKTYAERAACLIAALS